MRVNGVASARLGADATRFDAAARAAVVVFAAGKLAAGLADDGMALEAVVAGCFAATIFGVGLTSTELPVGSRVLATAVGVSRGTGAANAADATLAAVFGTAATLASACGVATTFGAACSTVATPATAFGVTVFGAIAFGAAATLVAAAALGAAAMLVGACGAKAAGVAGTLGDAPERDFVGTAAASAVDGAADRVVSRVLSMVGASSRRCRATIGSARRGSKRGEGRRGEGRRCGSAASGSDRSGSALRDAIADADGGVIRPDSVRSDRTSSVGAVNAGPSTSGVSMIGARGCGPRLAASGTAESSAGDNAFTATGGTNDGSIRATVAGAGAGLGVSARGGTAATCGITGIGTADRETTRSGTGLASDVGGESSRNLRVTAGSDRTGSGRRAASSGAACAVTCGVTDVGKAGRATTGCGANGLGTVGFAAGVVDANAGESSRSFRVTDGSMRGDSRERRSGGGDVTAMSAATGIGDTGIGDTGIGLAGRAATRSEAMGTSRESPSVSRSFREAAGTFGPSKRVGGSGICAAICAGKVLEVLAIAVVASSRSCRFTPGSSRNCRFVAGSLRGGAAATAGMVGFRAGPLAVRLAEPLAIIVLLAITWSFPGRGEVDSASPRSRSCREAGTESRMFLATAVGRVGAATRGVGTGISSSRVSLIWRAAAGAMRGCPEAGMPGAGRTAMGRGAFVRRTALASGLTAPLASEFASEFAPALPCASGRSSTDRETLALTF